MRLLNTVAMLSGGRLGVGVREIVWGEEGQCHNWWVQASRMASFFSCMARLMVWLVYCQRYKCKSDNFYWEMHTPGHGVGLPSRTKQWESGEGRRGTGHPLERQYIYLYSPSKVSQCFQKHDSRPMLIFIFIFSKQKNLNRAKTWNATVPRYGPSTHTHVTFMNCNDLRSGNHCRKDCSWFSLPRMIAELPHTFPFHRKSSGSALHKDSGRDCSCSREEKDLVASWLNA